MSSQITYAYKRHNTWVYRRTYPQRLKGILGSALKQSLKTHDAKVARKRVAELNATFEEIVAQAAIQLADAGDAMTIAVAVPRFQRARLLGEQRVDDLAVAYLEETSRRLAPGSYKSIRFAIELLVSHLGHRQVRDLTEAMGREVLGFVQRLSPNVRKYREGKAASLSELTELSEQHEDVTLTPQTQARIWKQMQQFLDWCVARGDLSGNAWIGIRVEQSPEPMPHKVLTEAQVAILLVARDGVIHHALLFGLLTGMRSGEICGLMTNDVIAKGNLGRFVWIRPNAVRSLKTKAAEREVPLHPILEQILDDYLPSNGRLFPGLTVDRVVKRYANLRRRHPELHSTVFHSTRKWFVTQCERTGVPEHFTASLVGHQSARSDNRLTYGLYSAGIGDEQKRQIIDQLKLPDGALT